MNALADHAHVVPFAGRDATAEGLLCSVVVQGAVAEVALLEVQGGLGGVCQREPRVSLQHRIELVEGSALEA